VDAIDDILFEKDPFSTEFRGMHARVEHHESAQGEASHLFPDAKCAPASDGEWAGGFGEFVGLEEDDDVGVIGGAGVSKKGEGDRGIAEVQVGVGATEKDDRGQGWVQFGSETSAGDADGHADRVQDAQSGDVREDKKRDAAAEHAVIEGAAEHAVIEGAAEHAVIEGGVAEHAVIEGAAEHAVIEGEVYGAGQGTLEEGQIREDLLEGEKDEEEEEEGEGEGEGEGGS
jgi:hypothetical protein